MITIIDSPRVTRSFLTYDLEWIPKLMRVRLAGVFDGKTYRGYRSVDEFLLSELTHANRGKWFYAHAGGLADFQFLLERMLLTRGYRVNASFSGSSAIIVHVTRGKNSWHFIDSYWLLKERLRAIGEWIGMSKGNADESQEFYENASDAELREYNEVDCRILYAAIDQFESVLLELGGQLKMTQASCAMELFRRRFLTADIETSSTVNELARQSYVASRVEVFQRECEDAYYYDVNSSFPYSMTFPVPGELKRTLTGRLPTGDGAVYLAECDIHVPDCYMPPIPRRQAGRIFFPVGSWRGWFTSVDLDLLERCGGSIMGVRQSMEFEPNTDLRAYANTLYDLRKKSSGFFKVACKYLLNSLYGKFAESEYKSSMLVNPVTPPESGEMLIPGVFIVERQMPIPHMHVPISSHITAIARRTLYDYMAMSEDVHYCDTDGFSSSDPYQRITTDRKPVLEAAATELGQLKLEKIVRHGYFEQAKLYRIDGTDAATGKPLGDDGAKGKGFSRMTVAKFEKLIAGEELEYVRMARIKETVRSGDPTPREYTIRKRLNRENISKRFFYPDGHSRPWHVSELDRHFTDAKKG